MTSTADTDAAAVTVTPASGADSDRVNALLIPAYARNNGTLDRTAEPDPCPATDSEGRPVRFFIARFRGEDRGAAGVTDGGDVTDWAVQDGPERETVARALIAAVEDHARARGAEDLNILVSGRDAEAAAALAASGFFETAPPIYVMRVVSFPRFLAAILADRETSRCPVTAFRVDLEPGLYPELPDRSLTVRVRDGRFQVETGGDGAEIAFRCTATDFSQFLLGGMTPFRMARRCRIRPLSRWLAALAVLRMLAPRRVWHTPLGEHR